MSPSDLKLPAALCVTAMPRAREGEGEEGICGASGFFFLRFMHGSGVKRAGSLPSLHSLSPFLLGIIHWQELYIVFPLYITVSSLYLGNGGFPIFTYGLSF